ncbi:MAG: tRNA (adenosine(37)-N6)-dimethylallyltransferase MiaA [Phototrophicales bacterium]|nr:tRNA (adenosine(37)-N6)-dimethylallyltransferase MiaA [Phototrophicales bacterium]
MPLQSEKIPLVVILGPTASGKTGLAIHIAQAIGGEIIGADSRQIYQYMDIGTAKPTSAEQAQVIHHLIDIINPDEPFPAAHYQAMVYDLIPQIVARGKIPMLVGGTGQYLTVVTEGWSFPDVPPNDVLRAELEAFAQENGAQALYDRLAKLDPEIATIVHPNNVRRVVRYLEVCLVSGEKMSDLQRKKPPPYRLLELGLTGERLSLYDRADMRVDKMLEAGFLDEVRCLLDMGYSRRLPSMSGLGYSHLVGHLLDGLPLDEVVQQTKYDTHEFIRRQQTWFKGHDNGILWHNVNEYNISLVTAHVQAWLGQ